MYRDEVMMQEKRDFPPSEHSGAPGPQAPDHHAELQAQLPKPHHKNILDSSCEKHCIFHHMIQVFDIKYKKKSIFDNPIAKGMILGEIPAVHPNLEHPMIQKFKDVVDDIRQKSRFIKGIKSNLDSELNKIYTGHSHSILDKKAKDDCSITKSVKNYSISPQNKKPKKT
jgi:hypothetical protein